MLGTDPPANGTTSLDQKRSELGRLNAAVNGCRACPLGASRGHAVPGEGPVDAEIMFIGEAPGYYEDQQGRPFVGAAGQFLEQLLGSIGLKRADVFIANVIKCRPPSNRDPLPEEISACASHLGRQLEILRPKLIVTLGRYSMSRFVPGVAISKVHGQARKVGGVWVLPMYHPAAALHQGNLRRTIEEDFRKIPAYLEQARSEAAPAVKPELAAAAPEAAQMKLFE